MKLVPNAATKQVLIAYIIKMYKLAAYRRCQELAFSILDQSQDLVDLGLMTGAERTAMQSDMLTIRNQLKNILINATSKATVDNAETTVKQMLQALIDPYLT